MITKCIHNSNSFIEVILIKHSNVSIEDAIEMATQLLLEEVE